jgi:hypothetical protein
MLSVPASLLLLLTVQTAGGSELSLSVASGTPAVLPGLALGLTAEGQRRFRAAPAFVAARLQWTQASAANENWIIDHHQFVVAAAAGLSATIGVGQVWAEAGGGVAGLYEILSSQQIERIQAAGVPGGTASSFTVGPYAFGEVGVGVVLRSWVRGFVAAGPTVMRTTVDGGGFWRYGALGRVGIAYDF